MLPHLIFKDKQETQKKKKTSYRKNDGNYVCID